MPSVSSWAYDTSKETGVSVLLLSGGMGTLYFINTSDNTSTFSVDYSYMALGPSEGSDIGASYSSTSMFSAGSSVINFFGDFSPDDFPRTGWIATAGASTGAAVNSDTGQVVGGGVSTALFFFSNSWGVPQAYVIAEGLVATALPGIGLSVGHVTYQNAVMGAVASSGDDSVSAGGSDPNGPGAGDASGGGGDSATA